MAREEKSRSAVFRCLVVGHQGLEAVSAKEVKEILGKSASLGKTFVTFETNKAEDICLFCYKSQSAQRVMQVLVEKEISGLDDAKSALESIDLSSYIQDKSFVVRSKIVDNDVIDTMESERELGGVIFDRYSSISKVDLENPDVPFFAYFVGKSFFFGIDFAGFDLSKRTYRLFCQSDSIKGTLAYSLVRLSGYKNGMVLVDPFSQSGTVCIEAALFASGKSVNYYNKDRFAFAKFLEFFDAESFFAEYDSGSGCSKGSKSSKGSDDVKGIYCYDSQHRHVSAAEKNAKVMGINKLINFSRVETEWMDTKFDKASVDVIVSNPPKPSINFNSGALDKAFQEFFYTADYILKSTGKIVLLGKNYPKLLGTAQRYNFTLKANYEVLQGKEKLNILVFVKGR